MNSNAGGFKRVNVYRVMLVLCLLTVFCAASAWSAETSVTHTQLYENARINEDVTWQGSVTIKGSLFVAPQATVRIEPGTKIVCISPSQTMTARVVIMGRIQANGTQEKPVVFRSAKNAPSDMWGGILLLSSMKNNRFEQCRIENAQTGIEARFSSLTTSNVIITGAETGIALYDSIATGNADRITRCSVAVAAISSELELRSCIISQHKNGLMLVNSSTVLSGITVDAVSSVAVSVDHGRIKMTSCTISGNRIGTTISHGEGEISTSRFTGNKEIALHLTASPLKVSHCRITGNSGDGIRADDNRATIWGNLIHDNQRYNLVYNGQNGYSLVQNWWGTGDAGKIMAKISVAYHDSPTGSVTIVPWLIEAPPLL